MSKTYKDKRSKDKSWLVKIKVSKKVKQQAKRNKRKLREETNPRALKIASADIWNFT